MAEPLGAPLLTVYLAAHCPGSDRALALAAVVRAERPGWRVEVIDLDAPPGSAPPATPPALIATPMYFVHGKPLFWGNPAPAELLRRLDRLEGA